MTIPALEFSKDLPVGATITIKDLGRKCGGTGTYPFFCQYHVVRGMRGVIMIVAGSPAASVSV